MIAFAFRYLIPKYRTICKMLVLVQTCDMLHWLFHAKKEATSFYSSVLQPMVRLTSYTILRKLAELIAYISTRSTWTPHGSVPSSNTCCTHTVTTNALFNMYKNRISTQQISLLQRNGASHFCHAGNVHNSIKNLSRSYYTHTIPVHFLLGISYKLMLISF